MNPPNSPLPAERRTKEVSRRTASLPLSKGRGVGAAVVTETTTWDELTRTLRVARTDDTDYLTYLSLPQPDKLRLKSAQGYYVPADCPAQHRNDANTQSRWCLTIDVEGGNPTLQAVSDALNGWEFFWHTTRSHHPDLDRRFRCILPVLEDMTQGPFERLADYICRRLESAGVTVDRKGSCAYSQPAFWPVIGAGQDYECGLIPGHWLSALDIGADPLEGQQEADLERAAAEHQVNQKPSGVLFRALEQHGLIKEREAAGRWAVKCPNHQQHSDPSADTAYFFPAHHNGYAGEAFKCHHDHCRHLNKDSVLDMLGVDAQERGDSGESDERTAALQFLPAADVAGRAVSVDWLVRGHMPKDSVGVVFGDPASYKSFWLLDIAFHVATGRPWHGHPVQQGAVILILGEGLNQYGLRLRAWAQHYDTDLAGVPLYVSNMAVDLHDPKAASLVEQRIDALVGQIGQPPVLVGVDTLARNFGAGDENSTQDMNRFIGHVDRHVRATTRAAVAVVHHTGHANKERGRGAMALKGALDWEFRLARKGEGVIEVVCTKQKDAEEAPVRHMRAVPVTLGVEEVDGEPVSVSSLVLQVTETYTAPAERMKGMGAKTKDCLWALYELWEQEESGWVAETDWRTEVSGVDRHFARWRDSLVTRGLVEGSDGRFRPTAAREELQ